MREIDTLIEQARQAATEAFRGELRRRLLAQPPEWLADRLVEHIMAGPGAAAEPTAAPAPAPAAARHGPVHLVEQLVVDADRLADYIDRYGPLDRQSFEAEGHLLAPPPKGGPLIGPEHRSAEADALLAEAKNLLYALLFGGEADGVRLARAQRELLTLTVPHTKLPVFDFLSFAATEIGAHGTWLDPQGNADDDRAANTLLQVEYGETAGELVGRGIVTALRVINDLEVNEQVLYARMENIEESTLI